MTYLTRRMPAGRSIGLRLALAFLLMLNALAALAATAPLTYIGFNSRDLLQPTALATTSDGTMVYAGGISSPILSYAVTPGAGTLTYKASSASAWQGILTMAMDPQDKFLYVGGYRGLGVFGIGAGGVLGAGSPYGNGSNGQAGIMAYSLAVDAAGNYLYALTQDARGRPVVYSYSINRTSGALGQQQAAFSVGNQASTSGGALSLSRDGKYVLVVLPNSSVGNNYNGGAVFAYPVAGGNLGAQVSSQPLSLYAPGSIALSNDGAFVYVASSSVTSPIGSQTNAIAGFSFNNGKLAALPQSPFSNKYTITALAVSPKDGVLYAAGYSYDSRSRRQPGYAGAYTINPSTGALTAMANMVTTYAGNPTDIQVSSDGKYVYVTNNGPAYADGGLVAYRSHVPALGMPQVDTASGQTAFSATVSGTDASLIKSSGFYYSTNPVWSATAPSVVATLQGGSFSASLNSSSLTVNTVYYVFPYVTMTSGSTYIGAAQSFTYNTPLNAPATSATDYSDVVVSATLGSTPQTPVATGFIVGGELAGNAPQVIAGTLSNGVVSAIMPRALMEKYGSYTLMPFATLSGPQPTGSPRVPQATGGVTYLGATTTLQNQPFVTVSASLKYDVPASDAMAVTFQTSVGDAAFGGAGAVGFCYGTRPMPTISDCQHVDRLPAHSLTETVTRLKPKTTYYVRAFVRYMTGTVYSDQLQFMTSPASACRSTDIRTTTAVTGPVVFGVNAAKGLVYALDSKNNIQFINTSTLNVDASVTTGARYPAAAYDDKRGVVYYATGMDGKVFAVDAVTGKQTLSGKVAINGKSTPLLAVDSVTGFLYVADRVDPLVFKLNPDNLSTVATAKLPVLPRQIEVNSVEGKLYVGYSSPELNQYLGVLSSSFELGMIKDVPGLADMTFNAATDQLFITNGGEDMVVDGKTDVITLRARTGIVAQQVLYANASKMIYNAMSTNNFWVVTLGTSPVGAVSVNPGGAITVMDLYATDNMVYVLTNAPSQFVAIDAQDNSISSKTPLTGPPSDSMVINQTNGQVFLGSYAGNKVTSITCK